MCSVYLLHVHLVFPRDGYTHVLFHSLGISFYLFFFFTHYFTCVALHRTCGEVGGASIRVRSCNFMAANDIIVFRICFVIIIFVCS